MHPWATKNGNLNHTGYSSNVVRFNISEPSWVVDMPGIMHTSPVIDADGNIYLTHTSGKVIALDKHGRTRWSFKTGGTDVGNPALLGEHIYVCSTDGIVHSLELGTGKEQWSSKIGNNCPPDSWVASAVENTLIQAANVDTDNTGGNCDVVAINTVDGSVKWKYSLCSESHVPSYNMMPSIVDGMVVLQDQQGGIHALSLDSGKEFWKRPGHPGTMTTGGMVIGPNGVVYGASNYEGYCDLGKGVLQALDLHSGNLLWNTTFDQGINAAPAVGPLGPGGAFAVVVGVANNFLPDITKSFIAGTLNLPNAPIHRGSVAALDAETGRSLWSYDVHDYQAWIYPMQLEGCLPDAFSNPAIGGDGTVYINWSGGYSYAIRDTNRDNHIDPDSEVSFVKTGAGMNGETAIAPGLLVVPSCNKYRGYET